jgi:hypothetical protein
MTSQLASRTRKARTESICPKCHHPIGVGVLIGKVGQQWWHIGCVLGRKPPMIGWHSGR